MIQSRNLKIVLTCCLFWVSYCGNAQHFFNLDFEYEGEKGQPRKWFIEGEDQFTAGLTDTIAHHGRKSLEVTVIGGQVVVYLSLPGDVVAGKSVTVNGFVRAMNREGLQLMIGFKDPAVVRPSVFPVKIDSVGKWENAIAKQSFESYTSDRLLVAMVIAGTGKVFVDDFTLALDGKEIQDDVPDVAEPRSATLKMLNGAAIPFTFDKPLNSDVIRKMIGSAKVVALGENSHGSSTIFKAKLLLLQQLIEKNGFTVFALECPQNEAKRINEYVQGGSVTKNEILNSLIYPAWKTQEMLDIIEWIRQYNIKNSKSIQFRGFDILDKNGVDRDRVMAEIVQQWMKNSQDRIILSGDNTHITKATGKMGYYLTQAYGERYVAVGFTFGEGTYSAYGPTNPYQVHRPYPGTSEYIFTKMAPDNFMLDIRPPQIREVFKGPLGFRTIGSRPQETTQFSDIVLPLNFDVILFLTKSVNTVLLAN